MRNVEEAKTMNERIRAFYKQSGGPNNPQIERIIEKHLLYGKDHGVPGKRETFKDAMMDVLLDDFSTKDLIMWVLKTKYELADRWQELVGGQNPELVAAAKEEWEKRDQLEDRMAALEQKLDQMLKLLEQKS